MTNFRFSDDIENGLLVYYFSSIFSLEYQVVPMLEFISLNYYKTMLVTKSESIKHHFSVYMCLSLTFSILFHHHCRLFRSYSGILALWNTAYKRGCKTNARLKTWAILAGNMVHCRTCFSWSNNHHLLQLSFVLNFFSLGYHFIGFNPT